MKLNKNLRVDLLLLLFWVLTMASGLGMYAAGHGGSHQVWHNWAVVHVFSSLFFMVAAFFHVYFHLNWYKGLFQGGKGKKSRVTIAITLMFVLLVITGILALTIPQGPGSSIGMKHYTLGLLCMVFFTGHIIKRHHVLVKALTGK